MKLVKPFIIMGPVLMLLLLFSGLSIISRRFIEDHPNTHYHQARRAQIEMTLYAADSIGAEENHTPLSQTSPQCLTPDCMPLQYAPDSLITASLE